MIDRRQAPPIRPITQLDFPHPEIRMVAGDIPLYLVPGPAQDLAKLDVLFLAGRPQEKVRLTARATPRLMREGAAGLSGEKIAELTDYYGGAISISDSLDHTGLSLQCLSRFFLDLLPIFSALILEPSFPERELQVFIRNQQQRLEENLGQNEVIAYREMTALIFGVEHPYGYNSRPEMYAALQREAIQQFWADHIIRENAVLLLSGQFDEAMISAIEEQLARHLRRGQPRRGIPEPAPVARRELHIRERDSLQNAIRIGRRLFGREHPDYYPLQAVNVLFGGYFGSRLMTSLREDLGLTYNIYSHLDGLRYSGYFYISAEVSKEATARTLEEIYKELDRLRNEPPEEEELTMMKQSFSGLLLHSLDGPFSRGDTLRNLLVEGGTAEDFNQLVQALRALQPEHVPELARRWLDPSDMVEVIIG